MLAAILKMAAKRSTVTVGEVARELSIDAALAERLFSELERQGYLKSVAPGCGTSCGACATSQACGLFRGLRLWTFTKKGALAAGRLSGGPNR
jgi:hypothetical protein